MSVAPFICSKCGSAMNMGEQFCRMCGTPVTYSPPPASPDATVAAPGGAPVGQNQPGQPPINPQAGWPPYQQTPPGQDATVAVPRGQPGAYPQNPPAYQPPAYPAPQAPPAPVYQQPAAPYAGYPPPPQAGDIPGQQPGYPDQVQGGYLPPGYTPPGGPPAYPYGYAAPAPRKGGFRWWIIPLALAAVLAVVVLGFFAGALIFPDAVRGILPSMPQPVAQVFNSILPSLTPTATPTRTPTLRPTNTFTPQPTATRPPPTATQVRTNTAVRPTATAKPFFSDDFLDPKSGWKEIENADFRIEYIQRRLLVELKHENLEIWIKPPVGFKPTNIEAAFEIPFEFETKDLGYFGAYCAYQDDKNYYTLLVNLNTNEMKFSLTKDGKTTVLSTNTWVKPIKAAPLLKNGSISIGFECLDGNYLVYNGETVLMDFSDRTLPNGDMRMVVGTFTNLKYPDGFPLMFSNVTVFRP